MTGAVLAVSSDTPGLAFAVFNSALERVEEGITPKDITLEPGLYVVRVTHATGAPSIPQYVDVKEGRKYLLQLAPTANALSEDLRGFTMKLRDGVKSAFSSATPATVEPAGPLLPSVALRFCALKNWTQYELVVPRKLTSREDGNSLWVDVELPVHAVVFAQAMVDGQVPVNTAVPGGGVLRTHACSLRFWLSDGALKSEAHLGDSAADVAAQYLRQGNFEEAKRIFMTLEPPAENLLLRGLNHILSRFRKPEVAAMGRYALLRTGELNWLGGLPDTLLNAFDWLADGKVISGELAAREGKVSLALSSLAAISEGQLPLYTDGFSMLLSRLIQYTSSPAPMESVLKSDVERANRLLKSIAVWARSLDMKALTLTFPGADITSPATSEHTITPDSEWTKIDPSALTGPRVRRSESRQAG
jgi:hypothetical protein